MTDPTIPELVARLRGELEDSEGLGQVLVNSASLRTLLDALERGQGAGNPGDSFPRLRGSSVTFTDITVDADASPAERVRTALDRGLTYARATVFLERVAHGGTIISTAALTPEQIETARAADRLLVTDDGLGFVYVPGPVDDALERQNALSGSIEQLIHELDNEGWDSSGSEAERKARVQALDLCRAKLRAMLDARFASHSPDGGKVEGDLRHYRKLVDVLQRTGQAADIVLGTPIEDVPGLLLQRSTWRPISEPPSAEVHAWCGGRYLMRHDDGELLSEHWDREFPWDAWASGYREYLPVPPSDERRG